MGVEPETIRPVLVLGLGNLLLADDGAGLELLRELECLHGDDPELEFVDGGTQGLALLGLLEGRRALLVLDAVAMHAAPGSVHHLPDPLKQAAEKGGTAHESSAGSLLAAAKLLGELPSAVELVGIEPLELQTRIGLSACVAAAVPAALARAGEVLARLREGALCTN
jgi:hydrogenase maturation protease